MSLTLSQLSEIHTPAIGPLGAIQIPQTPAGLEDTASFLQIASGYLGVFVVAFLVTLITTPVLRKLALANGIIDHPTDDRKVHRKPIAYMGGVGIFLGLMAGIMLSYLAAVNVGVIDFHPSSKRDEGILDLAVPPSILLGMFVIMMVGLLDDILHISPRIKVAGQLVAAAALAINDVAVRVTAGVFVPLAKIIGVATTADPRTGFETVGWVIPIPDAIPMLGDDVFFNLVYWTSTAVIAIFVLGACNASNLIDGLDGLLSGVTAIAAGGLTVIAIAFAMFDGDPQNAQQIVLGMAIAGACLGFLPYNFKPASIFLGDCGSLLLGFSTIALVLMLSGRTGSQTHLVVAGLVVYCIPIMDTILAIVRRKMTGKSLSEPDREHLHHMLQNRLGVRGAVLTLYAIGACAALFGIVLSQFASAIPMYIVGLILMSILVGTAFWVGNRKRAKLRVATLGASQTTAPGPISGQADPPREAIESHPGPTDDTTESTSHA